MTARLAAHLQTRSAHLNAHLRARYAEVRTRIVARPDRGSSSVETVVVIALLVALAIAVVGIISAKVITRARHLDLGG